MLIISIKTKILALLVNNAHNFVMCVLMVLIKTVHNAIQTVIFIQKFILFYLRPLLECGHRAL